MQNMVSMRFYSNEDYEDLISILKDTDLYVEEWETYENLSRKISRDPESIILALVDDKPVGCIFIMEDGWNALLWRLGVKEKYRKQGIGTRLLAEAESIVKKRGLKEVSLLANNQKTELKQWYKKHNYKFARDFTFLYKEL